MSKIHSFPKNYLVVIVNSLTNSALLKYTHNIYDDFTMTTKFFLGKPCILLVFNSH